jgi:membrane associated rhomboid family serine protease
VVQKAAPDLISGEYTELSLDGLKHGYVWQLLTFQFLHANWIHLLFNSLALYTFGRAVETVVGRIRFLQLYFLSGIVGGLVQMLFALLVPRFFNAPVMGASAGVSGLIAAFAVINWEHRLSLLFYFFPITLRGKTIFWASVIMACIGIILPRGPVAHAAHLGGLIMGFIFVRFGFGLRQNSRRWSPFSARQRKRELVKAATITVPRWPATKAENPADLPEEEFITREVDPILDKISAHGIQSLTERERRILEAARNKMAKR